MLIGYINVLTSALTDAMRESKATDISLHIHSAGLSKPLAFMISRLHLAMRLVRQFLCCYGIYILLSQIGRSEMRKFLFFAAAFLLTSVLVKAEEYVEEVEVGAQPMAVFTNDKIEYFDVFCLGNDADYDGEEDEGEEAPSWWRVYKPGIPVKHNDGELLQGDVEKLRDFEFAWLGMAGSPFRPVVDYENNILFIIQKNKIKSYDLHSGEIINDSIASFNANAVSRSSRYLFVSLPAPTDGDNYIAVYDIAKDSTVQMIQAYHNVQQTIPFELDGNDYLAAICEGAYGVDNDSELLIFRADDNGEYRKHREIVLGNSANYMEYNQHTHKLAIIMNGDHKLIVFDILDMEIEKEIELPTSGYDGPRECAFGEYPPDELYITSYSGKNFIVDLDDDTVKEFDALGKSEGITAWRWGLAWAIQLKKGTYEPSNKVAVMLKYQGVDPNGRPGNLDIYPNPASESFTVKSGESFSGTAVLCIYDALGARVAEIRIPAGGIINERFNTAELGMQSGHYILVVSDGTKRIARSLIINR
jgi:hypothetical protein